MSDQKTTETAVTSNETAVKPVKKNSSCLIVGCIVLALIFCISCLCIAGILIFSPNAITKTIFNQSDISQEGFTSIQESQIKPLADSFDQKVAAIENSNERSETLIITEEELLAKILHQSGLTTESGVGVDIREGSAEFVIPFDDILKNVQNNSEIQGQFDDFSGFDPSMLVSGLTLRVTISTTPNGKGIVIDEISTGNSFFDSFLEQGYTSDFESESAELFEILNFSDEYQIERLEFREGEIVIELLKN